MVFRMAGFTEDTEKRLAQLKKEVTRRGFDRHASILKNVSELQTELQSPAIAACEGIQTIIAFPPQIQRGWHYVPKQALLFTATGVTHLLASIWPGQEPQVTSLEGCNLRYMKIKLILLYGYLELGVQGESTPVRLSMEFNTVDWHRLWSPLQRLLHDTQPASILPEASDPSSPIFERALKELPLKFSNGLQLYGLLPGEELEEAVFQSGTWKRWLVFFQKPVFANTLLMLTSHYMVVIQEELDVKQGWIISYIPRSNIAGVKNQLCDAWNELSVQLKRRDQSMEYKLILKSEIAEAWCRRWTQHASE